MPSIKPYKLSDYSLDNSSSMKYSSQSLSYYAINIQSQAPNILEPKTGPQLPEINTLRLFETTNKLPALIPTKIFSPVSDQDSLLRHFQLRPINYESPIQRSSSVTPPPAAFAESLEVLPLVHSPSDSLDDSDSEVKKARKTKEPKRYQCKTCEKCFTTLGHLARHMRIHTGERKHKCPHPGCDSRFARQDNCMQHYRTHLNGGKRKSKGSKRAKD